MDDQKREVYGAMVAMVFAVVLFVLFIVFGLVAAHLAFMPLGK